MNNPLLDYPGLSGPREWVLTPNATLPITRPKETLSEKVQVSCAFRQEFNRWLGEFFGEEYVIYLVGDNNLVAHPFVLEKIRAYVRGAAPGTGVRI